MNIYTYKVEQIVFLGLLSSILSLILNYFLDLGIVVFAPVIFSTILTYMYAYKLQVKKNQLTVFLSTLCFFIYSFILLFLFSDSSRQTSIILIVPLITIAFLLQIIFLKNKSDFKKYINLFFNFFVFVQVVFCFLQYVYYSFGFGLAPIVEYDGMIAGTFGNSNDLASLLVLCSVYYFINPWLDKKNKYFFMLLIFIMLVLATSRFAFLIFIFSLFILNKGSFKSKLFLIFFLMILFNLIYYFVINYQSTGIVSLDRIVARIQTIIALSESNSLDGDYSIDLRLTSYEYFFSNLDKLGFGSLEFQNYMRYSNQFTGDTELIFRNPHSLLIEIGYWQGYLGLFLLFFMFVSWAKKSILNLKILFVILMVSFIPSTVIFNYVFWEISLLLVFFGFFVKENSK